MSAADFTPGVPPVFYVCGDTSRNPGRSGIQTVVRSLAAAFGVLGAPVRPVLWRPGPACLRPLPGDRSLGLGAEALRDPPLRRRDLALPSGWPWTLLAGGRGSSLALHRHPRHRRAPPGTWVLLPELMYQGRAARLREYVHRRGWRLAVILHDTIPIQHPEFVPAGLPAHHAEYLRALCRADLILPNSHSTEAGWREFVAREGLSGPPVRTCTLACDLPGVPRVHALPSAAPRAPSTPVRMLCVATLEPRKNHRALLAAYALAAERRPDLALRLDLVGARYVDRHDLVVSVQDALARHPDVHWHERIEHATLRQLYAESDFTVYPSVLEGFGLPVIESLWFGRPCLCANFGVMAENAAGGGCLTADVRDPEALAAAIIRLAESPTLRRQLAAEATARPLKTWADYAREVLAAMAECPC